jgi:general secretion pathway protein G
MIFVIVFFVALLTIVSSCGPGNGSADHLWRQAEEHVEKGDTQGAIDRLQKIIDRYPDARIAEKARAQIVVYRGLQSAVQAYPTRRARELMVTVARAIEAFRHETARVPITLDELVPSRMPSVPVDPWNRPFVYQAAARGYKLSCYGSDGAPGGAADAADILVVDGEFVSERP